MERMRRAIIAFALGLVFLIGFVVIVGPTTLTARLAETNLAVFSLGFVAVLGSVVCWSEGLRPFILDSGVDVTRRRLYIAYAASMLGRQVLPVGAVGGPAVTAVTVDREIDLGLDETLAIVTVAEFLSTIASLTMAAVGVGFLLGDLAAIRELRILVYGAGAFTLLLFGIGVLFLIRRDLVGTTVQAVSWLVRATVGRVSTRVADRLEPTRMTTALETFYDTVDELGTDLRQIAVVTALHFLGWLGMAAALYVSAVALGASISVALVLLLVPTAGLVDILPLPGGLGGVEIFMATLIAATSGAELALAAGVVLLFRIHSYWFLIVVGGVASAYAAGDVLEGADPRQG